MTKPEPVCDFCKEPQHAKGARLIDVCPAWQDDMPTTKALLATRAALRLALDELGVNYDSWSKAQIDAGEKAQDKCREILQWPTKPLP